MAVRWMTPGDTQGCCIANQGRIVERLDRKVLQLRAVTKICTYKHKWQYNKLATLSKHIDLFCVTQKEGENRPTNHPLNQAHFRWLAWRLRSSAVWVDGYRNPKWNLSVQFGEGGPAGRDVECIYCLCNWQFSASTCFKWAIPCTQSSHPSFNTT